MLFSDPPSFFDLLGQKSLLIGETGTGKTTFMSLSSLIYYKITKLLPEEITVLEFGPPRIRVGDKLIGGTIQELFQAMEKIPDSLQEELTKVHWIQNQIENKQKSAEILRPRLSARSADDVLRACLHNFQITKAQLKLFFANPTKVLLINDLSIYLHLGSPLLVFQALSNCETALLNAYYGKNLQNDYGSNISSGEKHIIERFFHRMPVYQSTNFLSEFYQILADLGTNFV